MKRFPTAWSRQQLLTVSYPQTIHLKKRKAINIYSYGSWIWTHIVFYSITVKTDVIPCCQVDFWATQRLCKIHFILKISTCWKWMLFRALSFPDLFWRISDVWFRSGWANFTKNRSWWGFSILLMQFCNKTRLRGLMWVTWAWLSSSAHFNLNLKAAPFLISCSGIDCHYSSFARNTFRLPT